jgi:hypothetical protein
MTGRINTLVNRFLGWKLPATFGPDAGISFKPYHPNQTPDSGLWPIGTNLLTASEAREMLEHVLADDPVRAALAELVAVKDIKERAAALHFGGINSDAGEGWEAEWKRLQGDYIERQPKAWAAARAALQDDAGVTMSGSTQIGAPGKSPIGVKGPEHG